MSEMIWQYDRMYKNSTSMKGFIIMLGVIFININWGFIPKFDLLFIMGVAMIVDFLSGVAKSVYANNLRNSLGFRRTVKKFIEYGAAILIGMGISYMSTIVVVYNPSWEGVTNYMSWFNSGLVIFIIFIEIVSILENLLAMDSKSKFAKYAILPALRILTIQIKQNPLTKISIETEDPDITTESITITKNKTKKHD